MIGPVPARSRNLLSIAVVGFAITTGACGPGELTLECIAVDPSLGDPSNKVWCEDDYYPTITWNGALADASRSVCLPPDEDQQCRACPADEVRASVEDTLRADLAQHWPDCVLEHWELGCMRTVANAKKVVGDDHPDFCCFQVALWGPGCSY